MHPNITMLRRFYESLPGGDVGSFLTPDSFAHVGGSNRLSGTHRGAADVHAVLGAYGAAAPDGLELDLHDILANDDHGMAIVRVMASRGGERYDEHETHVFELVDGSVAGIFVYWNDPAPADAFFA